MKEAPGANMTKEGLEFEELTKEMNSYFSEDDLVSTRVSDPSPGKVI